MRPSIFLSHSGLDKPFVRELDQTLRALGAKTFLDERDIKVGEDIPARIYDGLGESTHVCYIISENSIQSEWVADELSTSKMLEKQKHGFKILPVLLDEVELPIAVLRVKYADFRDYVVGGRLADHPAFSDLAIAMGLTEKDIQATAKWSDYSDAIHLLRASAEVSQAIEGVALHLEGMHSEYILYETISG